MTTFSQRLREARHRRCMSQNNLAKCSGLEPSAISHFETGRREPSIKNLVRLADALSITCDFLLAREDKIGKGSEGCFTRLERHIADGGAASRLELVALEAWKKGARGDAKYFLDVQERLANAAGKATLGTDR